MCREAPAEQMATYQRGYSHQDENVENVTEQSENQAKEAERRLVGEQETVVRI
jgi:hypothetical protein